MSKDELINSRPSSIGHVSLGDLVDDVLEAWEPRTLTIIERKRIESMTLSIEATLTCKMTEFAAAAVLKLVTHHECVVERPPAYGLTPVPS